MLPDYNENKAVLLDFNIRNTNIERICKLNILSDKSEVNYLLPLSSRSRQRHGKEPSGRFLQISISVHIHIYHLCLFPRNTLRGRYLNLLKTNNRGQFLCIYQSGGRLQCRPHSVTWFLTPEVGYCMNIYLYIGRY